MLQSWMSIFTNNLHGQTESIIKHWSFQTGKIHLKALFFLGFCFFDKKTEI